MFNWPSQCLTAKRNPLPTPPQGGQRTVHLRKTGVPPQRGRTSAIRQLVLQTPAPVIAKALGYHGRTAARLLIEAGGTTSRYAPGDNTRGRAATCLLWRANLPGPA